MLSCHLAAVWEEASQHVDVAQRTCLVLLQGLGNCREDCRYHLKWVKKKWFMLLLEQFGCYFFVVVVVVAVSFLVEEARCSVTVPWVILADYFSCICHFILVLKPVIYLCDFKGQPRTSTVTFGDVRHPEARLILLTWSVILIFFICLFWQAAWIPWDPFLQVTACTQQKWNAREKILCESAP